MLERGQARITKGLDVVRLIIRQVQVRSLLKAFTSKVQWKMLKHQKSLVLREKESRVSSSASSPETSDLDFSELQGQQLDARDIALLTGIYERSMKKRKEDLYASGANTLSASPFRDKHDMNKLATSL